MSTNNTSYKRVTPQVIAPMTDLDLTYKRNAPKHDVVFTPNLVSEGNAQSPAIYSPAPKQNTLFGKTISSPVIDIPYAKQDSVAPPILTYDEYMNNVVKMEGGNAKDAENAGIIAEINKQRQDGLTYAEGLRNDAYAAADLARQKGIVDADTSYQQNRATYGAKAEALRSMGLTGSGYSDYLDAQAYAAKRGEIQSVKAQAEAAKRAADTSYAANTYQINKDADDKVMTYKQGMLDHHLIEAGKGAYTEEEINKIISDLGYGETERNMLIGAMNTYNKTAEDALKATSGENYQKILSSILADPYSYTDADIDSAEANQLLTPDDAAALKERIVEAKRTEITDLISAGDPATAMSKADELYANGKGKIDQPTYQKLYNAAWTAYLSGLSTGAKANNKDTIIAKLEEDVTEGRLGKEDKEAIVKSLSTDSPILKGVQFNYDGGRNNLATVGNNFSVVCNGKPYRIESGGAATDAKIKELASTLEDGTVFGYENTIYIKTENGVFIIKGRTAGSDHYKKVHELFFGH